MKLPFRSRLLLGFLLVSIIPLLMCSIVMVRVFEHNLRRQTWDEGETQLSSIVGQLSVQFSAYERAAAAVADDPLVATLLTQPDESRKDEVYLALYRATDSLRAGAQFQLYDSAGVLRYVTDSSPTLMSLRLDRGVLRQTAVTGEMAYSDVETSRSQRTLMRCAMAIPGNGREIAGYVALSLNEASFTDTVSGLYAPQNTLYVTDAYFSPVYSNAPRDMESRLAELRGYFMATGRLPDDPQSDLRYHIAIEPVSGCYVIMEQPAQITGGALDLMYTISLSANTLCLLLCLLMSYLLSRSMTKPLERLNCAMEQVKQGDFSVRVNLHRSDEIGSLAESFNRMTGDLDVYMNSLVQRQRELNDAQIRMLQAQLNPHFLYNTLDTMKWTAKMNGVPEVASLAANLAVILRSSISSPSFVTLRQEIDTAMRYADIQKIRFSGRFRCVFELPRALEDCYVPKLVVQPLLENAIIHGLRDSNEGYVYVYAMEENGKLRLSVTDDGCGMDESIVRELNSGCGLRDGHLGFYNVSAIIRMNYGDGYGLHAHSIKGVGTTVTALMPIRKEAPKDDEGSDS